jgi:hypothetical protein
LGGGQYKLWHGDQGEVLAISGDVVGFEGVFLEDLPGLGDAEATTCMGGGDRGGGARGRGKWPREWRGGGGGVGDWVRQWG